MDAWQSAAYRRWLEESATVTLYVYAGLIVVLLPAFHFVLGTIPAVPPDSLALRLYAAAISAAVGLAVLAFPRLRRHSVALQFVNLVPTMVVIAMLVVDSGNNDLYMASGLLGILGAQQAFYRTSHLAAVLALALVFQAAYSGMAGLFYTQTNLIALAIYATADVIALITASLRIRIQQREISNRLDAQEMEERLAHLASTDSLTQLPNRQMLLDHLSDTIRRSVGKQCAVLFLDLDRFKEINDTLGHAVGDMLLQAVAKRFATVLLPNATLARWGGDEFVVVLASSSDAEASDFATRLILATAEPFFIDEYEFIISVSAGIAIYPEHGTEVSILIRNADIAMYRAKDMEDPRFTFFEPEMHATALLRHHLRSELRKAPYDGTLELHYQPVVDAVTTRLASVEALLRWRQSDGSLMLPDDFIPIAEESGLIVSIGTWVLQNTCSQIRRWQDSGMTTAVSVNVSARQLAHPEFVGVLRLVLRQTGIDPTLLELEITETALLNFVDETLAVLHEIKTLGVSVALDDFGTGYSSFAYLKRFPIDSLKLDRTFVTRIDHREDRAIVRSLITIAHTLGMTVTAEGVESRMQFEILADSQCDLIQGYFVSRPLPGPDFERYRAGEPTSEALSLRRDPQ